MAHRGGHSLLSMQAVQVCFTCAPRSEWNVAGAGGLLRFFTVTRDVQAGFKGKGVHEQLKFYMPSGYSNINATGKIENSSRS